MNAIVRTGIAGGAAGGFVSAGDPVQALIGTAVAVAAQLIFSFVDRWSSERAARRNG